MSWGEFKFILFSEIGEETRKSIDELVLEKFGGVAS